MPRAKWANREIFGIAFWSVAILITVVIGRVFDIDHALQGGHWGGSEAHAGVACLRFGQYPGSTGLRRIRYKGRNIGLTRAPRTHEARRAADELVKTPVSGFQPGRDIRSEFRKNRIRRRGLDDPNAID